MDLREVVVRYAAGEEGDRRVVGLDHLKPKGIGIAVNGRTETEDPVGREDKGRGTWWYPSSYSPAVSLGA